MGYTAKAVANYFLGKYGTRYSISALKLQKLVYIAHGWHMALCDGELLVDDEFPEAWQYGPVFPSLYHEFKEFGSRSITRNAQDFRLVDETGDVEFITPVVPATDEQTMKFLDKIWVVYGKFTGVQLSSLTHADGTPWHRIWSENPGMRNMHIPNQVVQQHYEQKRR